MFGDFVRAQAITAQERGGDCKSTWGDGGERDGGRSDGGEGISARSPERGGEKGKTT